MARQGAKSLAGWVIVISVAAIMVGGIVKMQNRTGHAQSASQATTGMPAPMLWGSVLPSTLYVCNDNFLGVNYIQYTSSTTSVIWMCVNFGAGDSWTVVPGTPSPIQTLDWQVQPGLFATGAVKSTVYYILNAAQIRAVVTRVEGSPICTAAPTVVVMDLGTSASTAYGSATALYSQATATSNTVVSNTGLSVSVAAGHFIGFALSAGTCVTPPTVSTSVTLQ